MGNTNRILIGLTGGIGAGKSKVGEYLQELGAFVISADHVGKEVMTEESGMIPWVRETFGDSCFDSQGRLLREKLGDIVFRDPVKKQLLDDRIFPLIYDELMQNINLRFENSNIVVVDAAMIFEWGVQDIFDLILTVTSPAEKIIARLKSRNNFTEEQIISRIESQLSPKQKSKGADYIISNDSDLDSLREKVREFWQNIIVSS